MTELTSAQKAVATRARNNAARKAKCENQKKIVAALEDIIKDSESSRIAKESALLLLQRVYTSW